MYRHERTTLSRRGFADRNRREKSCDCDCPYLVILDALRHLIRCVAIGGQQTPCEEGDSIRKKPSPPTDNPVRKCCLARSSKRSERDGRGKATDTKASTSQPQALRKPLAGDEQLDEWLPLLEAWWSHFANNPVTVNKLCEALSLDASSESLPLPTSLMRLRRQGPGALKRSMGRRLMALVGWPIGQFVVCDSGRDTIQNVRAWRLQRNHVETEPEVG